MKVFKEFYRCECGAVTVDWVVLCAAVIGIGFMLIVQIGFSTDSVAVDTANDLLAQPIGFGR
jgi:hypothetical protein